MAAIIFAGRDARERVVLKPVQHDSVLCDAEYQVLGPRGWILLRTERCLAADAEQLFE